MKSRREFLETTAFAAAGIMLGNRVSAAPFVAKKRLSQPKVIWGYLAQFGGKMWESAANNKELLLDVATWNELTERAAKIGVNVLVFDLGEGMRFPSHPELAVKGSWEPAKMKAEIARLKKLGIIAVPKLNFSSSHDQWLGKWRPYLSTPEYFSVCRDIIADTAKVFDESPLFHLGYDEETFFIQDVNKFEYKRLRCGNLWWHDFLWFVEEVGKHGMRPWIWSDFIWHNKEEFLMRMPKTVLQTNWYYSREFDIAKISEERRCEVAAYEWLEQGGFDQVPCGSTYDNDVNFGSTVEHCRRIVAPERLKGFLMAPWCGPTLKGNHQNLMKSLDVTEKAIKAMGNG